MEQMEFGFMEEKEAAGKALDGNDTGYQLRLKRHKLLALQEQKSMQELLDKSLIGNLGDIQKKFGLTKMQLYIEYIFTEAGISDIEFSDADYETLESNIEPKFLTAAFQMMEFSRYLHEDCNHDDLGIDSLDPDND